MHTNTILTAAREPLSLTLRRARAADLPAVLALLAEAAGWLNDRGVRQWPVGGFPAARIEPLITAGTLYVLQTAHDPAAGLGDASGWRDGEPAIVATMALDDHADPEFWTPDDRPETAYYVHKLCTSRSCAGLGLGRALLDWATLRALADGLSWLRLDCAKANPGLQGYYRSLGFRHVRTVDLPHRASGALFQRPAGFPSGYGSGYGAAPAEPSAHRSAQKPVEEAVTVPAQGSAQEAMRAPARRPVQAPVNVRVFDLTIDLDAETANAGSGRDLVLTR